MGNCIERDREKVMIEEFSEIDELNRLFRKKSREDNSFDTAEFITMDDVQLQVLFEKMEAEPLEINLDAAHQSDLSKLDLSNISSQRQYIHSTKQYSYSKK
ncbi:hypothetical protein [Psychrobacillus sp. FSL H8-0487]|uniref:hypothetical protein n=1 Tax=Psychrobacillus sp. FSL H8-0487 TaxID=2921391 RepID=UPI0030F69882